jgi:hypothetical protein
MAFSIDEQWVYNGQHIVAKPFTTPKVLGTGAEKIKWSSYIQGSLQVGAVDDFGSGDYPGTATVMIGRTDTKNTPRSLNTRGNVHIEGDSGTPWAVNVKGNQEILGNGQTGNALYVTGGGSVDSLYVDGDVFVSGKVDCGNKGKLASRFAAADASPKPFDIKHPTKGDGHRLRYACIEGPEVGVYCRGRVRNEKIIKLPYYWKDLVDVESISVQLQPIGVHQDVIVKRWDAEIIHLQAQGGLPVNCFYHVYGERKDVNPLITEYEGDSWKDYPDPNFNPETAPDTPNFNDPEYRGRRNTVTI